MWLYVNGDRDIVFGLNVGVFGSGDNKVLFVERVGITFHKLLNFKSPYPRLHNTYALCFRYGERHWKYLSLYQKQSA